MNDLEILGMAFNSLQHRQLRSYLAALGIIIGVASIISLISVSTGLQESITSSLGSLGSNLITISSGGGQAVRFGPGGSGAAVSQFQRDAKPITFREADQLRSIEGVAALDARVSGRMSLAFRNRNSSFNTIGTEPDAFPLTSGAELSEGRWLRSGDTYSVVLGHSIANEAFGESLMDKQVKINGVAFRVVGVLNQTGSGFNSPDNNIYMPQKTARDMLSKGDSPDSILVAAREGENADEVAGRITEKLRLLHRVNEENQDFSVITATQTASAISSVTAALGLFLGAISSISLLVGGIGVANAMFTSVLEQTRFIGILRSLGAKKIHIMKLFLYESCLLGLAGGIVGILLSFILSYALLLFGVPSKITVELVLLGITFSTVAGALSGIFPARNAASVEPVEALRYE